MIFGRFPEHAIICDNFENIGFISGKIKNEICSFWDFLWINTMLEIKKISICHASLLLAAEICLDATQVDL
jgi:hypothetical protein